MRLAVIALALVLGAACAAAIACGGAAMKSSAPPAAPSTGEMPETAPDDPHVEIEELDRDISAKLASAQISPPLATCSGVACFTAMSEPFSTPASDPACHPSRTDPCSNLCTLSTSICHNQERICELARQLRGDVWAANKCTRARASCQAAHDSCCDCVQRWRRSPPV